MMVDEMIASNCTIPVMILITLANFLCFIASLSKRIAHRTEPIMKRRLTAWSKKGAADDVVVDIKMN